MSKEKKIFRQYNTALGLRNFEIELFWKRSLFFWGFIASTFVAYTYIFEKSSFIAFVIACFGFVCSVAWVLVNRGSKRWQENWESIIDEIEEEVSSVYGIEEDITGSLFRRRGEVKYSPFAAGEFSVSKITIILSCFTSFIWCTIILYHLYKLCLTSLLFSGYPLSSSKIFLLNGLAQFFVCSVVVVCVLCCLPKKGASGKEENITGDWDFSYTGLPYKKKVAMRCTETHCTVRYIDKKVRYPYYVSGDQFTIIVKGKKLIGTISKDKQTIKGKYFIMNITTETTEKMNFFGKKIKNIGCFLEKIQDMLCRFLLCN